ncbi:amiloride-sensitive sodium channel subunit alpha-like [Uloborus diversus]|uniref:amiloride-sensitive sodium channel subunit alpha-like n=1 Tax=Uloborus diversus TaxID=327109 RepID=UPI002409F17B|nr:amiloride-sensitive sodium channel subunit alpha-like [Uloborus diversus]
MFQNGINFDNFVISCSFEGFQCYRENFTVLYNPSYGKCYMFNFIGDTISSLEKPIQIFNYGSHSGLKLILHVSQATSVDLLNRHIGARVVVHDPRDLPFVAEYGISLRPHDMSGIEVTQSYVSRLGPPYGSCVNDGSQLKFRLATAQYSILGCEKSCRHYYLTTKCNCTRRIYLRGTVLLKALTAYDFCKVTEQKQYECMYNVITDIESGTIPCGCKPPCQEKVYSYSSSASQLNENYFKAVKEILTLSHSGRENFTVRNASDNNCMIGVKVYYRTFQVDKDVEIASYSWETLVANIGGNLGFFMGLTLVTFVEIFEFLWDIMKTVFEKIQMRERSRTFPVKVSPS